MQRNMKSIAWAAAAILTTGGVAQAAPVSFQNAVQSENPFLYYRLQETGAIQDAPADNLGSSVSDGVYRGTGLTGGIAGFGAGSDTAVGFNGADNVYLRTTDALGFGPQIPQSSYEFIFKSNVPIVTPTVRQALFGVINSDPDGAGARTANAGVQLELNTANLTNNISATTTRMWLRDEASNIIMGNIAHGDLMDGNYHHFVVTVDLSQATLADRIKAYVDGLAVDVAVTTQGGTASDFQVLTRDPTFAARNVRGNVDEESNVTIDEAVLYGGVLSAQDVAAHATAAGYVVPEPGSLALVGLAGLGLLSRRRKA